MDDDVKFKDQVALHIMSTVLGRGDYLSKQMLTGLVNDEPGDREYADKKIEKIALFSYRVANAMKKAKLTVFK